MKFKIKHSFYHYRNDPSEEYCLYVEDQDYSDFPWRSCGLFSSQIEAEYAAKRIAKLKEPDVELEF